MHTFLQDAPKLSTAISIGNFDAVHKGHVALIHAARSAVGKEGRVEVWSFDPSPCSVLKPEVQIDLVTTFSRRQELLFDAGANAVIQLEPTPELLHLNPEAFIAQLTESHAPDYLVEGAGFRFGNKRKGTIETLHALGEQYNFKCIELQGVEVTLEDQTTVRASSSKVRSLIHEGRMQDVTQMLGRDYALSGVVTEGDRRGRELGIPTANLGHVQTMLPP